MSRLLELLAAYAPTQKSTKQAEAFAALVALCQRYFAARSAYQQSVRGILAELRPLVSECLEDPAMRAHITVKANWLHEHLTKQ